MESRRRHPEHKHHIAARWVVLGLIATCLWMGRGPGAWGLPAQAACPDGMVAAPITGTAHVVCLGLNQDGPHARTDLGTKHGGAPGTPSTPAPSTASPVRQTAPARGAAPVAQCTYRRITEAELANLFEVVIPDIGSALVWVNFGWEASFMVIQPIPGTPPPAPNLGHPPDEALFWKDCPGEPQVVVWRKSPTPSTSTVTPAKPGKPPTPAVLALYSLSATVTPKLSIGVNPDKHGITGLESYFWVAGYDGAPVTSVVHATDPATGATATLALRATPVDYVWSFGDGNRAETTSPGVAYPAVSSIRNTYDVRSDRSRLAVNGVYQVRLTATFDVAYQVIVPGAAPSAGGWVDFSEFGLGPVTVTAERDYHVIEIISVLVGP